MIDLTRYCTKTSEAFRSYTYNVVFNCQAEIEVRELKTCTYCTSIKHALNKPIIIVRACSYDPAYRDVSLTETNISVRSYGIFRPACRDEITM
jgi:hypothetical protein